MSTCCTGGIPDTRVPCPDKQFSDSNVSVICLCIQFCVIYDYLCRKETVTPWELLTFLAHILHRNGTTSFLLLLNKSSLTTVKHNHSLPLLAVQAYAFDIFVKTHCLLPSFKQYHEGFEEGIIYAWYFYNANIHRPVYPALFIQPNVVQQALWLLEVSICMSQGSCHACDFTCYVEKYRHKYIIFFLYLIIHAHTLVSFSSLYLLCHC